MTKDPGAKEDRLTLPVAFFAVAAAIEAWVQFLPMAPRTLQNTLCCQRIYKTFGESSVSMCRDYIDRRPLHVPQPWSRVQAREK
jgi:hypothetical protein